MEGLKHHQHPSPPESSLDGLCWVPGMLPWGQVTQSREHSSQLGCLCGPCSWPSAGQPLTWQAGGAAGTHSHSPGRDLHPAPLAAPPAPLRPGPCSAARTLPFGRGPLGPWAGHDPLTLACGSHLLPGTGEPLSLQGAPLFPQQLSRGGRYSQGSGLSPRTRAGVQSRQMMQAGPPPRPRLGWE